MADLLLSGSEEGGWWENTEPQTTFYDVCRSDIPIKTTCRYCGKSYLTWVMTDTGWRLRNAGGIHSCKSYMKEADNAQL